jgi:ubiquitin-like 1-activating enzyme E1 B
MGSMVFDKDDELALDFVTAAANIRAHNFGIKKESIFKIKEMAGKIVPAISSSNALVAALQTTEAIKLLANADVKLRCINYTRLDKNYRLNSLQRTTERANPNCPVC